MLRTLTVRRVLKKFERDPNVSPQDKANIAEVLADRRKLAMLVENCECCHASQYAAGVGSPLTDFLDWLLNNQDSILAFIKAIISLFQV